MHDPLRLGFRSFPGQGVTGGAGDHRKQGDHDRSGKPEHEAAIGRCLAANKPQAELDDDHSDQLVYHRVASIS